MLEMEAIHQSTPVSTISRYTLHCEYNSQKITHKWNYFSFLTTAVRKCWRRDCWLPPARRDSISTNDQCRELNVIINIRVDTRTITYVIYMLLQINFVKFYSPTTNTKRPHVPMYLQHLRFLMVNYKMQFNNIRVPLYLICISHENLINSDTWAHWK